MFVWPLTEYVLPPFAWKNVQSKDSGQYDIFQIPPPKIILLKMVVFYIVFDFINSKKVIFLAQFASRLIFF